MKGTPPAQHHSERRDRGKGAACRHRIQPHARKGHQVEGRGAGRGGGGRRQKDRVYLSSFLSCGFATQVQTSTAHSSSSTAQHSTQQTSHNPGSRSGRAFAQGTFSQGWMGHSGGAFATHDGRGREQGRGWGSAEDSFSRTRCRRGGLHRMA